VGLTRFALAYLNDVGPANPKSMVDALERNKLKPVASVGLDRNAEKFDKEAETLIKGEPEMVLFISNARPVVKMVEAMRVRGYNGQFAIASFAGFGVIDGLKQASHGLILSQVLPPPTSKHLKFVGSYIADMTKHAPSAQQNYTSLEGYLAARVLVEGLRRASSDAKLIAGLETMERVDLGGYEISYSPTNHSGSRYVNTGIVDRTGSLRF
jgi:ABC-type branched-subunit amino acid transport system substrate-binding protein